MNIIKFVYLFYFIKMLKIVFNLIITINIGKIYKHFLKKIQKSNQKKNLNMWL